MMGRDLTPGTEEWAKYYSTPWRPHNADWQHPEGKCCAMISGGWSGRSCGKTARTKYGTLEYCGTHDPAKIIARHEKREAEWKARAKILNDQSLERERLRKLRDAALEAIRQIAAGHNDPRTLAMQVLKDAGE